MSEPSVYVRWFDGHGGPTHLKFKLEIGPTPLTTPWIMLGVRAADDMTEGDIADIPEHAALLDGGFSLDREQAVELHRQLGAWLEGDGK